MNFLAHLALSPANDAIRVGNLLGDFVKGTISSLRAKYPHELVDGIVLHRAIDKFTDKHPAFLASRELLATERRRFAGVVVDLIYDHFLSLHWQEFYDEPLQPFIRRMYHVIESHPEWQLGRLKQAFPYMRDQDWLSCYGTRDGIHLTFRRVAQRGKFTAPISESDIDLEQHYAQFEQHFLAIYQDLRKFVRQ